MAAEINSFLSAEAQKEVENYIASLEVIASKYKDIATASLQLEKAKQEEAKTDSLLIKNKQQLEVLAQKKIKTQSDEQKASEKLTKAIEKENSAYQQLNEKHKSALKTAKDLATQYGINSKEAKKAALEANKYGEQLKKIDASLGNHQRNVGNYSSAFKKGFSAMSGSVMSFIGLALNPLSIGIAAVAGTVKILGGNIMENQSIQDRWQSITKSSNAVLDVFTSSMIGNYKGVEGLNDRMKEAAAMVELLYTQYQKLEGEELKEARRINTLTIAISAYKKQASDMTLTEEKREEASIKAYFKETELLTLQASLAKEKAVLYNTELLIKEESGKEISRAEKKQLNDYLEASDNAKAALIFLEQEYRRKQREVEQAASKEQEKIQMDAWAKEKKLLEEKAKQTNVDIDFQKKQDEAIVDEQVKNREIRSKLNEEYAEADRQLAAEDAEYYAKKEQEKADAVKKAEEEKQAARQKALDMSIQMVGMLFDYQQVRLEAEMASIERYYETRINAASNAGEDTQALEREYEIKRAEMDIKIAKSKRNQALVDVAINTAVEISKALATPWLIPFISALGAAQAGIILSQPLPEIPAFGTGTESTPDTFIAGERGREIGITKEGRAFITPDQATLYSGMPGTKIIPNQLAELVLKDIGTNVLDRKLDKVIAAIEKNQTSVFIDKSLSRSINLKHIRSKHGRN